MRSSKYLVMIIIWNYHISVTGFLACKLRKMISTKVAIGYFRKGQECARDLKLIHNKHPKLAREIVRNSNAMSSISIIMHLL